AYQYMQMLPKLASGDANKMWIVPSELNDAMKGLGQIAGGQAQDVREYVSKAAGQFTAPEKVDVHAEIEEQAEKDRKRSDATVEKAIADAQALEQNKMAKRQQAARPAIGQGAEPAPVEAPESLPLGDPQQMEQPAERPDFQ
ncbi:MAG: SPFH/Band 7/PHB domain protein, partial [Propionibacteriaceae bacterium]|nr:SPFH/Band 7/PHB domain protein [Propionibacteriaceae bacterium]